MSSKKPDKPDPAPPPVAAASADIAQEDADAKRREKKRFDWSKTILRPGGLSAMPDGTKSTLG